MNVRTRRPPRGRVTSRRRGWTAVATLSVSVVMAMVVVLAAGAAASARTARTVGPHTLPGNCQSQAGSVVCTFSYTGSEQTFVVPSGVSQLNLSATGASGGNGQVSYSGNVYVYGYGGLGGTASETVPVGSTGPVTPGGTLYVEVGGQGTPTTSGFNGGGALAPAGSGGGGGATDIRTVSDSTPLTTADSRLLVGGGGGGGGGCSSGADGGAAGQAGTANCGGTAGGAGSTVGGGSALSPATAGMLGQGGAGYFSSGGGGGGYYGGGGGNYGAGGGGGSSWTSEQSGTTAVASAAGDGSVTVSYVLPVSQTITFAPLSSSATVGASETLSAAGGGSGHPVTFSVDASTTNSACTVSGNQLRLAHVGTCVVDADQAGASGYDAAPEVQQSVTVLAAATTVSLGLSSPSVAYGQPVTATATVGAGVPGQVQFSVDGQDVGSPITVADGTATSPALGVLSPGGHQVGASFTPSDATDFAGSTAIAQTLGVNPAPSTVSVSVGPAPSTVSVSVGPAPSTVGVSVAARSLTARVSSSAGDLTGTVTFSVGGKQVGTALLINGVATLSYTVPSGQTQAISAVYNGDADVAASSVSTSRSDPSVTAKISSRLRKTRDGWYRTPVKVTFSCSTAGAPLTGSCPAAVILSANGAAQSVTRTIRASNGGAATITVNDINIDRIAPKVRIDGVSSSSMYFATGPAGRCLASDSGSGLASCRLSRRMSGDREIYTATAVDKAGHRSTTRLIAHVSVMDISGATYRDGVWTVKLGHTYTLLARFATRPRYVYAGRNPLAPRGGDVPFLKYGTHRWDFGVTFTRQMRTATFWKIGIAVGHTVHVLQVRVLR